MAVPLSFVREPISNLLVDAKPLSEMANPQAREEFGMLLGPGDSITLKDVASASTGGFSPLSSRRNSI